MRNSKYNIIDPGTFDVLAAAWVMACNDDEAIMTYESILYRLNLPADYNVRIIIKSRAELFRQNASHENLDKLKARWRASRQNMPSWIRAKKAQDEIDRTIDELTVEDVFRSQFRAKFGSERSEITIIEWGLNHIDRLRRANYEAREARSNACKLWLAIILGFLTTVFSGLTLFEKWAVDKPSLDKSTNVSAHVQKP